MSKTQIKSSRKKKIRHLISMMNKQNERMMPAAPPLIESIDLVITDEELDYLLRMGVDLYTREQAASLTDMPREQFHDLFESLLARGFVRKTIQSGKSLYTLNALLVGWFEAQSLYLEGKPEEREFHRKSLVGEYLDFWKRFNIFPLRNLQNAVFQKNPKPSQSVGIVPQGPEKKTRIIPVNRKVEHTDTRIYHTETLVDLIEAYGEKNQIVRLNNCMCRVSRMHQDKSCRLQLPDEMSCLTFGEDAQYWVDYGHGQVISKQEALDLIRSSRDLGAIHSVFHERDDANLPQVGICICCWDCCGLLSGYNSGATALSYKCYYSAKVVGESKCTGCGICEKYCPTTAARVIDKTVVIDPRKCIGCGQCVHQCPQETVIELIPNERDLVLPLLKQSERRL